MSTHTLRSAVYPDGRVELHGVTIGTVRRDNGGAPPDIIQLLPARYLWDAHVNGRDASGSEPTRCEAVAALIKRWAELRAEDLATPLEVLATRIAGSPHYHLIPERVDADDAECSDCRRRIAEGEVAWWCEGCDVRGLCEQCMAREGACAPQCETCARRLSQQYRHGETTECVDCRSAGWTHGFGRVYP